MFEEIRHGFHASKSSQLANFLFILLFTIARQAVAFASFTGSANPNTARPGASSGNVGNGHDSDDDDEEDAPRRTARGLASARGNNSGFLSSRGQQQQPHSARNGSSSARNTGRMGESGIRPLPADGRQWAAACLFASRFRDLVSALPKDQSRFALVDFAHCPGLLDLAPSSASATATAAGYGMAPAVAATAGACFDVGGVLVSWRELLCSDANVGVDFFSI